MAREYTLWVDKYRPKLLSEGFVAKNTAMKRQIEEWIANPKNSTIPIPNLLLSGPPGTGKCLDGEELLDIQVDVETLTPKQRTELDVNAFTGLVSLKYTIRKLFKVFDCDELGHEQHKEPSSPVNIRTPLGYKPIRYFVKKKGMKSKFTFSDGSSLHCSNDHLIFEENVCKKITEAKKVATLYGHLEITKVKNTNFGDLYDVSIDTPHQYVTPTGIIHHNTTLARLLCNEMEVEKADILDINASRESNVDTVRDKIVGFCSSWPNGEFKVVILDEADGFGQNAQRILRGEIEKYGDYVRFILTANYPNKIIPALHSRLQSYHFDALDMDEYINRLVEILHKENVKFDLDDLMPFINRAYPDLRKGINLLEQYCLSGELTPYAEDETGGRDYLNDMVNLFKEGRITEARRLVCSNAKAEDYEDIYRFFYQNLALFGSDDTIQSQAIVFIAQGLRNHALSADPEINLAATMCLLAGLSN